MATYQAFVAIFKKIDPAKKFHNFTYQPLQKFEDVNSGDCKRGQVLEIGGNFFLFQKEESFFTEQQGLSKIVFMDKKKEVASIKM